MLRNHQPFLILAVSVLAACGPSALAGNDSGAPVSGVEATAEFEIAKRQKLAEDYAPQAMQKGTAALAERDYETAYAQYKAAVDALPDAPNVRDLRTVALDGFSKAVMGLAEQRIAEGRWEDAKSPVEVLLQPQYNPNYKPAQRLLARLEAPDYFNKTLTPGFVSKVELVKKLLVEAQGLYDSGQFEDALKKYEEVLQNDRYNIAARRGMEQVNLARMRVTDAAYNDTRAGMITAVDKGWELPVRRLDGGPAQSSSNPCFPREEHARSIASLTKSSFHVCSSPTPPSARPSNIFARRPPVWIQRRRMMGTKASILS
ncbi:MAG: hypothetical protein RIR25_2048 [Verrucomicrobiota bacterium]|jgi:general secretion pathway protein D